MFLDSLRTLSFKYVKCIIPSNLTYLYILKSYYHLKVLYHTILPFTMDLRQKRIEITCCTGLLNRDCLQEQSKAGEFAVWLFNWYCKCWWRVVLMKSPWVKVLFSPFVNRDKTAQTACSFQYFHDIYTFREWDLHSHVREPPAPWSCIWHFKWCKSVEIGVPSSVFKRANIRKSFAARAVSTAMSTRVHPNPLLYLTMRYTKHVQVCIYLQSTQKFDVPLSPCSLTAD